MEMMSQCYHHFYIHSIEELFRNSFRIEVWSPIIMADDECVWDSRRKLYYTYYTNYYILYCMDEIMTNKEITYAESEWGSGSRRFLNFWFLFFFWLNEVHNTHEHDTPWTLILLNTFSPNLVQYFEWFSSLFVSSISILLSPYERNSKWRSTCTIIQFVYWKCSKCSILSQPMSAFKLLKRPICLSFTLSLQNPNWSPSNGPYPRQFGNWNTTTVTSQF